MCTLVHNFVDVSLSLSLSLSSVRYLFRVGSVCCLLGAVCKLSLWVRSFVSSFGLLLISCSCDFGSALSWFGHAF